MNIDYRDTRSIWAILPKWIPMVTSVWIWNTYYPLRLRICYKSPHSKHYSVERELTTARTTTMLLILIRWYKLSSYPKAWESNCCQCTQCHHDVTVKSWQHELVDSIFIYSMKPQYPGSSCPTTSGARPFDGNVPTPAPAPTTNIILNTAYWLYCDKTMLGVSSTLYIYLI